MEKFKAAFSSLLVTNMGLARGERVVVFSDQIRPDETVSQDDSARRRALHASARGLADYAAENFGNASFVDFPATAASGVEPPESLWRTVFGDQIVASLAAGGVLGRILEKKAADSDLETAKGIVAAHAGEVARVVIA
ncbi:MAG: peptidase, partial [Geobacter sp.]|nr:peptidase [Geobacter sp.]